MATRTILDSTLTDIADAIRAKTGSSASMTPAQMPTEIGSIPTGGGGSVPSVISKIDGGSFTLASDQKGDGYNISHSLGVAPKGFAIWTEDEISGTVATRFLGSCAMVMLNLVDKNANTIVASGEATVLYNGSITALANAQLNSAQTPNYMNSERIRWNNSLVFYKAGLTYKWLAWA